MNREDDMPKRTRRFFTLSENGIRKPVVDREFDISRGRFPVVYGDEQAAKPGTLPDLEALMYAFEMVRTRNPNLVEPTMFLGAWELEREAISMLSQMFNHPDYLNPKFNPEQNPILGWFTDGGTGSLHQAGWTFRNKYMRDLEEKINPTFDRTLHRGIFREQSYLGMVNQGLLDPSKPPVVLAPVDIHFAGDKTCDALGIGSANIVRYELNPDFTTNYESLKEIIDHLHQNGNEIMFVLATAGAVDTGRVEDVAQLSATLQKKGVQAPLIVDAAQQYMMLSMLSDQYPAWDFRVDGVEAIVADPHKTDASPYPASVIIYKDRNVVYETQNTAAYLHADDNLGYDLKEAWKLMPQFSTSRSPIGAIATWAHLSLSGKKKLTEKYQSMLDLTKNLADYVRSSAHFDLICEPQTGIVSFHVKDFEQINAVEADEKAKAVYTKFSECNEQPRFYISFTDDVRAQTSLEKFRDYQQEKIQNPEKLSGYGGLYIQVMHHMNQDLINQLIDRLDLFGYDVMRQKRCVGF